MFVIPWANLIVAAITAILMWTIGWIRTYLARRIAVSTPVERKVKKLSSTVKRQTLMLEAVTDRQALHAQATIILANAVKTGDASQIAKTLDIVTASENQFLASLTAHAMGDVVDLEEEED